MDSISIGDWAIKTDWVGISATVAIAVWFICSLTSDTSGKSKSWIIRSFSTFGGTVVLFLIILGSIFSYKNLTKDPYEFSWESYGLCITMPEPRYTIGIVGVGQAHTDWHEVDPVELSEDIYKTLKKSGRSGNQDIYVSFIWKEIDKYGNESTKQAPAQRIATVQMSEVSKYVDSEHFEREYKILDSIVEASIYN